MGGARGADLLHRKKAGIDRVFALGFLCVHGGMVRAEGVRRTARVRGRPGIYIPRIADPVFARDRLYLVEIEEN